MIFLANKLKSLHVYIICNNRQIKQYDIIATKKFNINDETYVVKDTCCYLKKIKGQYKEITFYIEGNPNPFDLSKNKNEGLRTEELDSYIGGDIFNILIECQEQQDRSKHILQLAGIVFFFGLMHFISMFF